MTGPCGTCGGWGFTWAADDVAVPCEQGCPPDLPPVAGAVVVAAPLALASRAHIDRVLARAAAARRRGVA